MSENPNDEDTWSRAHLFLFRATFAYFALFAAGALLDTGPAPRAVLAAVHTPVVGWFGHSVMHLAGSPNESGALWTVAQQVVAIGIALAIAVVWSLASPRTEHRRLNGWMRLVLRYYVAVIMMIYGAFKVIPSQFPPISLDQVTQPLGSLAPMGLLWSFMGYSAIYTMFAGLGETVGAFLLFFRRTTTAGALILIAVLSNVALMNYAYDVPVKQLSSNLLLASIVLVLPDVRRLVSVFVLNETTLPADFSFQFPRWLQRIRRYVKPVIVVAATIVPLVVSGIVSPRLRTLPPLYGVYRVTEFARNGASVPPLATDSTRWKTVVFGRAGVMSVRLMTDSLVTYAATVDSATHHIAVSPRSGSGQKTVFEYQPLATGMKFRGVGSGDTIDVTVERVDVSKTYRLFGGR
jgi:hypothetical protein